MTPRYTARDEAGLAATQAKHLSGVSDGHMPVQGQFPPSKASRPGAVAVPKLASPVPNPPPGQPSAR